MARGASGLLIAAGIAFIGSGLSIAFGCGVVAAMFNPLGISVDCGGLFILPLAVGFVLLGLGIFVVIAVGSRDSA